MVITPLPRKRARIFVVDDQEEIRELLYEHLIQEGFQVSLASSGEEALEALATVAPDLLLLDVQLPGLSGIEVTRRIRQMEQFRDLPILMMTGYIKESTKQRALDAGANDFLGKPFSGVELISRIRTFLKVKTLSESLQVHQSSTQAFTADEEGEETTGHRVLLLAPPGPSATLITTTLTDSGFESIQLDGEGTTEAILQEVARIAPDIVICDLGIGREKSIELLRELSQAGGPDRRLILVAESSHLDEELLALQIDDYILLPIEPIEIQLRLQSLIRNWRQQAQAHQSYRKAVLRAITDSLTKLYNHGYFREYLNQEIQRAQRYELPVSLIMIDIDYFKEYNDQHGHPQGDRVLKEMARLFHEAIRTTDMAARYGGEEFAIVLLETEKRSAFEIAERIRKSVEAFEFPEQEMQPERNLTISLGLATFPDDADSADALIRNADRALYRAKIHGKNRTEFFTPPEGFVPPERNHLLLGGEEGRSQEKRPLSPPFSRPITSRILLLGGDERAGRAHSSTLRRLGCEVVQPTIRDETELLAFHPDLVLAELTHYDEALLSICRRIKGEKGNAPPMILAVVGEDDRILSQALAAGADEIVRRPFSALELRTRVETLLCLTQSRKRNDALQEALFNLAEAVEARDPRIKVGGKERAALARRIGETFGLSSCELEALDRGMRLLDIGLIGVPEALLTKSRLSPTERRIYQSHPEVGHQLLAPLSEDSLLLDIVRSHHEALDGSGYPDGRGGEELHRVVRIAMVVDHYLRGLASLSGVEESLRSVRVLKRLEKEASRGRLDLQVVQTLERIVQENSISESESHDSPEP
ncbi:MAG: diguanylate cyclase [Deltaproteobacteria bacterium]|nr:MAG: diguanylate cyclase [Deltaproteobacteria bacterium]